MNPTTLKSSKAFGGIESKMHAFNSDGNAPIQFWGVAVRGVSTQPALCLYSCVQASGDGLTDVENYYKWCQSHSWSISDGMGGTYAQTDTLDADTFEPLTATVDSNTYSPAGLFGSPAIWNDLTGYNIDPLMTPGGGAEWDKAGTRAGIITALDSVNWSNLWAGSTTENSNFQYNRVQIGFNQNSPLPFTGGTYPFGPPADGTIKASPGGFGPSLLLTGTSGVLNTSLGGSFSSSDSLGVDLVRAQIQIRNFRGAPIPYFIYETADVASGVTILGSPGNTQRENSSIALANTATFFRKVSEGFWTADRQIIQLPDAAMNGPQRITAPIGTKVRNGTFISMVIGQTFNDWALANFGASWADYVFT